MKRRKAKNAFSPRCNHHALKSADTTCRVTMVHAGEPDSGAIPRRELRYQGGRADAPAPVPQGRGGRLDTFLGNRPAQGSDSDGVAARWEDIDLERGRRGWHDG